MIPQINSKRFKVIAKPNSKSTEIVGWDEDRQALRVNVAAPPDKNKANIALTKFLCKELAPCKLISGASSREKYFEFT